MNKQKIAIYLPVFLNFSETFIYKLAKNITKYEVLVICKGRKNEDKFPFGRVITIKRASEIPELIRRENIRLVHAQFGLFGAEIVDVVRKAGIPLITHFRGQDAYQLSKRFFIRLSYRNLFKKGELFLTVSAAMKKHLIGLGCPAEKIKVYYGGIDLAQFPFEPRKFVNEKKYTILMCGRFVEKKGYELGLRAVEELAPSTTPTARSPFPALRGRQEYDIAVNLIGEGPEEEKLKALAVELGIADKVKFLGKVGYEEIKKQMSRADLLLAPYRTAKNGDSEGIPNIIKEALAVGLPVVTTDHSGNPELAIDKKTALVARENDLGSLIEKLNEALTGYPQFGELTKNGRQLVEEKFDLVKQLGMIEDIYEKVLEQ